MESSKRNRLGEVKFEKNQFWQRNGQKATVLLLDHLPEKGHPF